MTRRNRNTSNGPPVRSELPRQLVLPPWEDDSAWLNFERTLPAEAVDSMLLMRIGADAAGAAGKTVVVP